MQISLVLRFEILTAVTVKVTVFWGILAASIKVKNSSAELAASSFRKEDSCTLKTEAVHFSDTSYASIHGSTFQKTVILNSVISLASTNSWESCNVQKCL
jgi:hypothetical protein